jgi:putative membrane protein
MIQHLMLASIFPPLLLLGLPEFMVAPIFRVKGLSRLIHWLTYPAVAFLVFNLDINLGHLPAWYDLTLRNDGVHILEHVTFMVAGVIVWWPVLSPIRSQRLSLGMQELYLFANMFPLMGLGIFFSFWQHPLYTPYIQAPRLWGLSALNDQQAGGLIMWMPGDVPYAVAMAAILMAWFDRGDPLEQRRLWVRPTPPQTVQGRPEESVG